MGGLNSTLASLESTLADHLERGLPVRRVAMLAGLLILAKVGVRGKMRELLIRRLLSECQQDSGWVDNEDTAWCSFVLGSLGECVAAEAGVNWLIKERSQDGWGYCRRDHPCIPLTATVLYLHPELADTAAINWLIGTWRTDLNANYQLSYKGAWFLLAMDANECSEPALCRHTAEFLTKDQRTGGGWGPWRDHPAPDDAFTTGIALAALGSWAKRFDDKAIFRSLDNGLRWVERNRLEGGLFPTHYIEHGSAWIALGEGLALKGLS